LPLESADLQEASLPVDYRVTVRMVGADAVFAARLAGK
jgi:hypothetical protein